MPPVFRRGRKGSSCRTPFVVDERSQSAWNGNRGAERRSVPGCFRGFDWFRCPSRRTPGGQSALARVRSLRRTGTASRRHRPSWRRADRWSVGHAGAVPGLGQVGGLECRWRAPRGVGAGWWSARDVRFRSVCGTAGGRGELRAGSDRSLRPVGRGSGRREPVPPFTPVRAAPVGGPGTSTEAESPSARWRGALSYHARHGAPPVGERAELPGEHSRAVLRRV